MKLNLTFLLIFGLVFSVYSQERQNGNCCSNKEQAQGRFQQQNKGMRNNKPPRGAGFYNEMGRLSRFDLDQDGLISEEEGQAAQQQVIKEITEDFERFRQNYNKMMLKRFDKNKDGKLDEEESNYLKKVFIELNQRQRKRKLEYEQQVKQLKDELEVDQEKLKAIFEKCKTDIKALTPKEKMVICHLLELNPQRGMNCGNNEKHNNEGADDRPPPPPPMEGEDEPERE